jgi:hypothetical protein
MRVLSLLSTTMLLMSCAPVVQSTHAPSGSVGGHEMKSEYGAAAVAAHAGLQAQVEAWNRGDLEAALSTYWDAPQMTWVSRSGVERGFASFADGMRKDFADPAAMGAYSVEVLDVRGLGPETGSVVFRWQISRAGKRVMGGTSTQIWCRVKGTWKAVLEHAS